MAMTNEELMQILTETGAYQSGHFKLSSGLHSGNYIQCSQLLKFPRIAEKVCAEIGELFKDENIEMVVGPATGGILVAYEVGRALNVPAIFAERENGVMTLRRGFHVEPGTRCLVTEDVLTTGGSAQEVVELLQSKGAEVVAATSIIDRTPGNTIKLKVPFKSLIQLSFPTHNPEECPMCKEGMPIQKPGSRPGI